MATLNILFMALTSRANTNNEAPVYCRLMINQRQQRFMIGEKLPLILWDRDKQRAKGKSPKATAVNARITQLTQEIHRAEAALIKQGEPFEVEDIVIKVQGKEKVGCRTLMQLYQYRFKQMKALQGKDYTSSTLIKFVQLSNGVRDFLKEHFSAEDISLSKVDAQFLQNLEVYLKTIKGLKQVSANKIIQKLKSVIRMAVDFGWLPVNPFPGHHFKHDQVKVVYLTHEELNKLEAYPIKQERLRRVRDIFLFSVYTGLHYLDAMSLTPANIVKGVDGKEWIVYVRQKTSKEIHIPLLQKAKQLIIDFKGKYQEQELYLLPRITNQKVNSYLKEVGDIVGIDVTLTHKIARKTFGSVLLYYDVPMKVVSELMGHASVLITERHYAQVELRKLGTEMGRVDRLLANSKE